MTLSYRFDTIFLLVLLVVGGVSLYALYKVRDAEARCDARYAPYMAQLYNSNKQTLDINDYKVVSNTWDFGNQTKQKQNSQ